MNRSNGQKGGKAMKVFFYVFFLIVMAVALFAVQNSGASPIVIKFLLWKFETSLVYTILGSILLGILVVLLFWIPRAIRGSLKKKPLDPKPTSG